MADSSRDPIENAQLKQLIGQLQGLLGTAQKDIASLSQAETQLRSEISELRAARQGGQLGRQPPAYGVMGQAARETEARQAGAPVIGAGAGPRPLNLRTADLGEMSAKERALAESAQTATSRQALFRAELERSYRVTSLSSLAYQRHGALTTEFIRAAAAGQVTVRDLGNEMALTLGKFGGWTAAAGLIYGGLRAISSVKEGALAASSAVQNLSRFLPELNRQQAFSQIAQQASQVNVPLRDVGESTSAFARIFKNQNDVMTASRVALTATKLDNIDLADSYRYLTSLTQEYGLSAGQLPGVFDQVSAAQRELGARVSETFPALARSAAAVKNAGGDMTQLLGLLSLTIVRTGQTGSSVGTAFYRGASNPQQGWQARANQDFLRLKGIDVSQGYTQALAQGISEGPQMSGEDRRRLAQAFFGRSFGGRFASVFSAGPQEVQRFLGAVSPAATKGTAQTELNRVLGSADERLKALTVQVQVFGAELAQVGALKPLGFFVAGLTEALHLVNTLLRVVNDLPGGFGRVLVPVAEMVALFRVLQSRNLGSIIPGRSGQGIGGLLARPGILAPTPVRQERKDIEKGVTEQRTYLRDQQAQSASQNARLRYQIASQNEYIVGLQQSNASQEQINAEEQRIVSMQAQSKRLMFEETVARRELNALDEQRAAYIANMGKGMGPSQAAVAAGLIYRPGDITRPGAIPMGGPVRMPGAKEPFTQAESGLIVPAGVAPPPPPAEAAPEASTAATLRARLKTQVAAQGLALQGMTRGTAEFDAALEEMVGAETAAAAQMSVSTGVLGAASALPGAMATSVRGLIGGLRGFFFNPWFLVLFGIPEVINLIQSGLEHMKQVQSATEELPGGLAPTPENELARSKINEYVARVTTGGHSLATLAARQQTAYYQGIVSLNQADQQLQGRLAQLGMPSTGIELAKAPDDPLRQQLDHLRKLRSDQNNVLTQVGEQAAGIVTHPLDTLLGTGPADYVQQQKDKLDAQIAAVRTQMDTRRSLLSRGRAGTDVPDSVIAAQVNESFGEYQQGLISFDQLQKAFSLGIQEVALNPVLKQKGLDASRISQINALKAEVSNKVQDLNAALSAMTSTDITSQLDTMTSVIQVYGAQSPEGRQASTRSAAALGELAVRARNDPYSKAYGSQQSNLEVYAKAQEQVTSSQLSLIQQDLTLQLRAARTVGQRAAAYNRAAAAARGLTSGLSGRIAQEAAAVGRLEAQLASDTAAWRASATTTAAQGLFDTKNPLSYGTLPGEATGQKGAKVSDDKRRLDVQKRLVSGLQQLQKHWVDQINEQVRGWQGLADKAVNATSASDLQDTLDQIAEARAGGDPLAQAQVTLQRVRARLASASAKDRPKRLLDVINAENALYQAEQDNADTLAQIAEARSAGDPLQAAQIAIDRARTALGSAKDKPKATLNLVNAENQAYQARQDRYQTLNEIAQARAENDPIRQATLARTLAQHEIATARGEGDRLKGELDLARADTQLDQARRDHIAALFTYRESLTQDPAARARLELLAAQAEAAATIAHGGPNTTAALQARGKVNEARNSVRQANVQAREDTIQFQLDMHQISTETAIREYQALLNIHNLTKETRRQILRQIQQLREGGQSDFGALNLGSIRLPTPYEIRRGLIAATQGLSVTNHYDTTIKVDGPAAATAVGTVFDRYHAGTGKALARAQGKR